MSSVLLSEGEGPIVRVSAFIPRDAAESVRMCLAEARFDAKVRQIGGDDSALVAVRSSGGAQPLRTSLCAIRDALWLWRGEDLVRHVPLRSIFHVDADGIQRSLDAALGRVEGGGGLRQIWSAGDRAAVIPVLNRLIDSTKAWEPRSLGYAPSIGEVLFGGGPLR